MPCRLMRHFRLSNAALFSGFECSVQWAFDSGQFIESNSLSGDSAACILAFVEATFLSSGATCEWNLSNVAGVYLKQLRVVLPCLIMTPEREKRVLGYVSAVSRLQAGPLPNQCLPGQGAPTNRLSFWLDWRVRCIEGSALQLDKRARFHPGVHIGGGGFAIKKLQLKCCWTHPQPSFLKRFQLMASKAISVTAECSKPPPI